MLPIRFASVALLIRLSGLLLLLGAAFLTSAEAGPLPGLDTQKFGELIEPKNDPTPTQQSAPKELTDYRRKVRQAVNGLSSLGEVAHVLLLPAWNTLDLGVESAELLEQAKTALSEEDDAFQRQIQKMLKTADPIDVNRAIVGEIKSEAREKLEKRLQTRTRFYLREGESRDRIAVANLLSETMLDSRRQDRHESLTSLGAMREPPLRGGTRTSRQLRQKMAALSDDLERLVENPNSQVQVAAIRALSDLEIPAAKLVAALKPKLASENTPVVVRRTSAEALGHVLARMLEELTNFGAEDRPQPRLKAVEQILPVAVLGLSDTDVRVRGSSLIACERAARVLDELTRNQPQERRVLYQSTLQVVTKALPKINEAARDPVPALRVSACRVLETLALAALRIRGLYNTRPPLLLPEPSRPESAPPREDGRNDMGVTLPKNRRGRKAKLARSSQWATARVTQPIAIPLPPRRLPELSTPSVRLGRPIKLPAASVLSPDKHSGPRTPNADRRTEVRPAAFLAQRMDELPVPTPVPGFWNKTVQTMMTRLRDPDYRVRLSAVDVLETLGDRAEEAIPALVNALRDRNKFVRWGAARTLGRLAPHRADIVVPGLVAMLNDREDIGVREKAVLPALEEYGEDAKVAVAHLARVINRGDKEYILAVLRTIRSIGTEAAPALPNVAWLLSDRTQPTSVRIDAANTLGRFGEYARKKRVLSVLRDVMLNDPNEDIRDAASSAVLAIDRPLK